MTQTWKQPKRPSTDERVKKMWCAVEYYSAIKKNKIIPSVATRMDIKIIILSEEREKDKYTISLIYGI